MLGLIHRTVIGMGPEHFKQFFVKAEASKNPDGRICLRGHNGQLRSYRVGRYLEATAHSLLGAIDVYNLLPEYIIAAEDVSTFQNRLQQLLKCGAREGIVGWPAFLSNRHLIFQHPLLMFSSFTGLGNDAKDAVMKTEVHTGGIHECMHGWINFGNCVNKD